MSQPTDAQTDQPETPPFTVTPSSQRPRSELGEKWHAFGRMWLEPFNASLSLLLLVMYALGLADIDSAVGVLSQTVLAIGSGVLGGRIANAVSVVNSEAILKTRGTVAVRGLNLMLRNVGALDTRVGSFLKDAKDTLEAKNYQEIRQMLRVLSEEGVTSIENWIDIVPEAKAASIAGHLSELRDAIDQLQAEKTAMQEHLKDAAVAGAEVQQQLRDQIAAKDARISALEKAYTKTADSAVARLWWGENAKENSLDDYQTAANRVFINTKKVDGLRRFWSNTPPPPPESQI